MNVILGDENIKNIDSRYVVLELDQIRVSAEADPLTAFCLVEQLPLPEIPQQHHYLELHKNLIKNYRRKNWKFCQDAIEHLIGRWRGELDTFYMDLLSRVNKYQAQDLEPDWDGVINRF